MATIYYVIHGNYREYLHITFLKIMKVTASVQEIIKSAGCSNKTFGVINKIIETIFSSRMYEE